MSRMSRQRRWMESITLAAGAGFTALLLQPDHAPWWRYLVAFSGAALPVLAAHKRGGQTAQVAP
jgi:hypothetical protein